MRAAGVGQHRQAAEPRQVDLSGSGALDEEAEDDGQGGEVQAGPCVSKSARDTTI